MKPLHCHLQAFGWNIYLSRERLRIMPVSNNRGNRLARRLRELRNRRWNKRHGQCELCGNVLPKESMSLHHILPYAEFPLLATRRWNLLMLCPCCHFLIHQDLPRQTHIMEHTARQHGINLEQVYHQAALSRWEAKQTKKGATA